MGTLLILPAMTCDNTCSAVNQRSSPEPRCPRFLLGVSHVGMQHPQDWLSYSGSSRLKTGIPAGLSFVGINVSGQVGTAWPKVSDLQKQVEYSKGPRDHIPEASHRPILKIGMKNVQGWNNQLGTATLTLYCPLSHTLLHLIFKTEILGDFIGEKLIGKITGSD